MAALLEIVVRVEMVARGAVEGEFISFYPLPTAHPVWPTEVRAVPLLLVVREQTLEVLVIKEALDQ